MVNWARKRVYLAIGQRERCRQPPRMFANIARSVDDSHPDSFSERPDRIDAGGLVMG
ncbi:MAG: hypothetical protein KAV00_05600 [Phycisphaerae bacterium]|nr:hypothetical protein [Phycisphaerae bacterium]